MWKPSPMPLYILYAQMDRRQTGQMRNQRRVATWGNGRRREPGTSSETVLNRAAHFRVRFGSVSEEIIRVKTLRGNDFRRRTSAGGICMDRARGTRGADF